MPFLLSWLSLLSLLLSMILHPCFALCEGLPVSLETSSKGTLQCRQGGALDEEAQARATSVYLVQKVIPMLPRLLCEQLCSLNPGQHSTNQSIYISCGKDSSGGSRDLAILHQPHRLVVCRIESRPKSCHYVRATFVICGLQPGVMLCYGGAVTSDIC